jgi:hypothetical protein
MTVEDALMDLCRKCEPGALPCLRQTAALRLVMSTLAGLPCIHQPWEVTDEAIDLAYWQLRQLHDGPRCPSLEPGP